MNKKRKSVRKTDEPKMTRSILGLYIYDYLQMHEYTTTRELCILTGAEERTVQRAVLDVYEVLHWQREYKDGRTVIHVTDRSSNRVPLTEKDFEVLDKMHSGQTLSAGEELRYQTLMLKLQKNKTSDPETKIPAVGVGMGKGTPQSPELETQVRRFIDQVIRNVMELGNYSQEELVRLDGLVDNLRDSGDPLIDLLLKGTQDFFPCEECRNYFNGCLAAESERKENAEGSESDSDSSGDAGLPACQQRFVDRFQQ